MRTNFKLAAAGALGAAAVLVLTIEVQAEQRHGLAPGMGNRQALHTGVGTSRFDHRRYGQFGPRRRYGPYVVGGIYAGAAVAGAALSSGADYGVAPEEQAAPGPAPAVAEPAVAEPAAAPIYAPAPPMVATVVYRPVTQTYTVPVRSYRYVQHTHYVPVTSYQAVTTNVAVPVTTYQTYQRTINVPETVYRPVHTCGCSYYH
jgi:hypothetical protein